MIVVQSILRPPIGARNGQFVVKPVRQLMIEIEIRQGAHGGCGRRDVGVNKKMSGFADLEETPAATRDSLDVFVDIHVPILEEQAALCKRRLAGPAANVSRLAVWRGLAD